MGGESKETKSYIFQVLYLHTHMGTLTHFQSTWRAAVLKKEVKIQSICFNRKSTEATHRRADVNYNHRNTSPQHTHTTHTHTYRYIMMHISWSNQMPHQSTIARLWRLLLELTEMSTSLQNTLIIPDQTFHTIWLTQQVCWFKFKS